MSLTFVIERALSEVTKQFTSALSNPQTGAWKEVTINRTFAAANFQVNTMQMNALIFYYFDEKVADLHSVGDAKNQIVVSNTYIFAFVVGFGTFLLHIQNFDLNIFDPVPLGSHFSQ